MKRLAAKENLTSESIKSLLRQHKEELKIYRVSRIGLFGSYRRGEQAPKSDLDFLVEFDKNAFDLEFSGFTGNYTALLSFLCKIFGHKVDLVTDEMLSPYIKPYILEDLEFFEAS